MISTVYIAKTVYGGDGLGRLGDGRVVFVPGAVAGEQVRAELVEEKKHFVRARLVEVVESSPARIPVPADTVPGMDYAHMTYEAEVAAKEQQLVDFFERARIAIPKVERLAGASEPAHYRNKVTYHFAKQGGAWVLGYRKEPSHEIVDVTQDPLAAPAINAKLPEIRRSVFTLLTQGPVAVRKETERKANVTVRWSPKTGVKWWVGAAPQGFVLKETTCGRDFEVPADGFYQVNPAAAESLVQAVVADYREGAAVAPNVVDLYCGVGVFGLSCRPPKLVGIESGRQAIDFARRNAAAQGVAGNFFAEEVGRNMKRIALGRESYVIVDPPRGGLEPRVPEWLARSAAPRLAYVSCDPATLVRDLRILSSSFSVSRLAWVDMFPRTARFETFVSLVKKA